MVPSPTDILRVHNMFIAHSFIKCIRTCLLAQERYAVPRALGMYSVVPSPTDVSARNIIQRIVAKRQEFEARNDKKQKSEANYYQSKKEYVQEL